MSNITESWAEYKGSRYNAVYNDDTGLWDVDIPAGAESSYNQPNHTYPITLHAKDAAGNETVMQATDPTYGDELNIRVLEKTKPTATITYPTEGSVLGSATQDIKLELQDAGGSGLNMASVIFKVNNVQVSSGLSWSDSGNKKICTYHATNLSDGQNSVSLQVSDNDGNVSDVDTVSFVISTKAPTLNLTSPIEGLLTNSNKVTVSGVAAPGSDAVTIAEVKINDETVSVGEGGAFSKELTGLPDGDNTITVVAKDSLGRTTTVTRHITVDTQAPVISDVEAEATTVNANGTIRISFRVVDPAD